MLNKLSLRNAKRSIRDYLVYLITMTIIAAFMFAFNSMIFSKSVQAMCADATVMACMIGLATFFIVLISAWLIHYMVHFMLEKRSREFGTYLLLGMKLKQVSKVYTRENIYMGLCALVLGLVCGSFLQQVLMSVFYHVFSESYQLNMQFSPGTMVMTVSCFMACFLLALIRNNRMFKKMDINDFMKMEKENEKVKEGHERGKQLLFFLSVIFFIVFYILMYRGKVTVNGVILCVIGFLASIYMFYNGLAALLVHYIQKEGKLIFRHQNLFLLRQMASKIHTMRFTMGTITILLTVALLGGSVAMMFAKYENQALNTVMPFDVLVYSKNPGDNFEQELHAIEENAGIKEELIYRIYQDGTHDMNDYLYTHVDTLGKQYQNADGTVNEEKVKKNDWTYNTYDTYMKLSDYNKLRKMLGLDEITLKNQEYAIQTKERIEKDLNNEIRSRKIVFDNVSLTLSGVYTDAFSQSGNNGADYLIIVPDAVCEQYMQPYFSNLAVTVKKEPTQSLQDNLEEMCAAKSNLITAKQYEKKLKELEKTATESEVSRYEDSEEQIEYQGITMEGIGTDEIFCFSSDVLVSAVLQKQMLFVVTAVIFPLVYIGLVFLCVALTILAVQQLSDSNKYKFRYDVLRKLGLSETEIDKIILKQLAMYYLTPAVIAVILSAMIAVFAGNQFVRFTGAHAQGFQYFLVSFLLFIGIYFIYFAATYIGFKRNIHE